MSNGGGEYSGLSTIVGDTSGSIGDFWAYPFTFGWGPTWNLCGVCGQHYTGVHYHPPMWVTTTATPVACGAQFHDFAQLKQPTGGKPRLFCRKCGETRTI